MQLHLTTFVWAWLASCATAFIVPEELVSFLSIVYSNIPPIKKGTDSRVGLGFRLGPHADAQIVLELGPQTNTQPLGNSPNAIPDSRKRHTHGAGLDPLDQDGPGPLHQVVSAPGSHNNVAASNWLSTWRTSILKRHHGGGSSNSHQSDALLTEPEKQADPTKLSGEPLVFHLRKLYRGSKIPKQDVAQRSTSSTSSSSTTTTSSSSTAINAGLSTTPPTHIFKPAFKLRKPGPKASLNKVALSKPAPPRDNLSDVTLDD